MSKFLIYYIYAKNKHICLLFNNKTSIRATIETVQVFFKERKFFYNSQKNVFTEISENLRFRDDLRNRGFVIFYFHYNKNLRSFGQLLSLFFLIFRF